MKEGMSGVAGPILKPKEDPLKALTNNSAK